MTPTGPEQPGELEAFEAHVRSEQARAQRIQHLERSQVGSIRGEAKRKAKRKQQKQARKRNR